MYYHHLLHAHRHHTAAGIQQLPFCQNLLGNWQTVTLYIVNKVAEVEALATVQLENSLPQYTRKTICVLFTLHEHRHSVSYCHCEFQNANWVMTTDRSRTQCEVRLHGKKKPFHIYSTSAVLQGTIWSPFYDDLEILVTQLVTVSCELHSCP